MYLTDPSQSTLPAPPRTFLFNYLNIWGESSDKNSRMQKKKLENPQIGTPYLGNS